METTTAIENSGIIDEAMWLRAAANNPAFEDLTDPIEDIYTIADGKPVNDE